MTPVSVEMVLLERSLTAVEQLLMLAQREAVPFHGPTELAEMHADEREAMLLAEEQSYRERPAQSALYLCLVSAGALLEVSHSLMNRAADPSPQEREREWDTLAAHTKIAGRSAYRAALILADPTISALGLQRSTAL